MSVTTLSPSELQRALSIQDLADPAAGPHAMQLLLQEILQGLRATWGCEIRVHRRNPIVSVADNYDRLHYPPEGVARDARYSRYVNDTTLLRTHTTAMIPPLLRELSQGPIQDVLLACPGLTYRRDCIGRIHTGEPQQMDLWRIRRGPSLDARDLLEMIRTIVQRALPGREWKTTETSHPYTQGGLQIDVRNGDEWVEIGECGIASPTLLWEQGLDTTLVSGLAMGLGLDGILMLRKRIDDIRLLRAKDPRIAGQMLDLHPYQAVSSMPAVRRDLSLALEGEASLEALGDAVRASLGERAEVVESVTVLSVTPYDTLPAAAVKRLGMKPGQKNVLLRIALRALDRTLNDAECNALRDTIYESLHKGTAWEWTTA